MTRQTSFAVGTTMAIGGYLALNAPVKFAPHPGADIRYLALCVLCWTCAGLGMAAGAALTRDQNP